jgi:hypothetical protein
MKATDSVILRRDLLTLLVLLQMQSLVNGSGARIQKVYLDGRRKGWGNDNLCLSSTEATAPARSVDEEIHQPGGGKAKIFLG